MALDVIIRNPMMHVDIACCPTSIISLRSDGTLWARGVNKLGEFGIPPATVASSSVWMQLELDNVERLFNVYSGIYAVRKDGSLWYTGYAAKSPYTPEYLTTAVNTWREFNLKGVIKAFRPKQNSYGGVMFITNNGNLYKRTGSETLNIVNNMLHNIIDTGSWVYRSGANGVTMPWYLSKHGVLYFTDNANGNLRGGPFTPSGQMIRTYCISSDKPIKELWVDNSTYDSGSSSHNYHFHGSYRVLYFDGTVAVRCVKYNKDYNANVYYAYGFTDQNTHEHTVLSVTDVKQTFASFNNIRRNMYLLKTDGTVWVCGQNSNGCLGINNTDTQIGLIQSQIDKVEYISGPDNTDNSAQFYTVFVKKDGGLFML